jgi:superfamily II DNA or RNA helicase
MLLRSRQQEFVDRCMVALADNDNTLGVAPTGAGKTLMFSKVIGEIHKDNPNLRACVLAHRDELTAQNEEKFKWVNPAISTSIVDSYVKSWEGQVTFAMVQTLTRENNLEQMPPVDLLVIDEAHHVTAPSYKNVLEYARKVNPKLKILGVTATPERGDKSSLGEVFNNCCDQIKIGELILSGNLVRPVTFAIDMGNVTEKLKALRTRGKGDYSDSEVASILDSEPLNSEVVRHWREKAGERKTVIFCSNVSHATNVTNSFNAAGISTALVTGEMTKEQRAIVFENMTKGMIQVIVNVAVLTEGWDYPPISCVVLLRQSSFKSTMIQMIGRGLRTIDLAIYPDIIKKDCVVLDFGISTMLHGSLDQMINLSSKNKGFKICPSCKKKIPKEAEECPLCNSNLVEQEQEEDKEQKVRTVLSNFEMAEIDLLGAVNFHFTELEDDSLLASGFNSWAYIHKKGDVWFAAGGRQTRTYTLSSWVDNEPLPDIPTRVIYQGGKLEAIAAANDFLNLYEKQETAMKTASWRNEKPTEKQLNLIPRDYRTNNSLTRGDASAIIAYKKVKDQLRGLGVL